MSRRLSTALLALVAFALRLAFGLWAKLPPAWDGELYERAARGIASGLGYSCFMFGPRADPRVPTAYYPVGYPAFLGALYALFGARPWVLVASGALVGALTVALTHRLALRVASPRAALLAALTLAVMPGQVMFASTPMTEGLWGLCLACAVYALARVDSPRRRDFALCALALAAATYVRPQALLLAPALPFVLAAPLRVRSLRALGVTALVLCAVLPWSLRNRRALGAFALVSTNGGANLAIGAVPEADGMYFRLGPASGCGVITREVVRDRCWRDFAVMHIRRDPWRWAALAPVKLYNTVEYETFPLKYADTARAGFIAPDRQPLAQFVMSLPWRVLCALCLLALAPLYPRKNNVAAVRLCVAAVAVVLFTHAVFFGGDRYHLPIASFVAVLAATVLRGLHPRRYDALPMRPAGAAELCVRCAQDPCNCAENSGSPHLGA